MSRQRASAVACHSENHRLPRSHELPIPPWACAVLSSLGSQLRENSAAFQAVTAFGRGTVTHKCCCHGSSQELGSMPVDG